MKKINSNLFKLSMSKFATGVIIITINNNNQYLGKTVNSFASLSLKPPLIIFSLDKNSSSLKKYIDSSLLGINILSKNQKNISNYFSKKKPKWNNAKYFLTKNEIPIIDDCVANFECKLIKTIYQGDHLIFICEIKQLMIDDSKKPLIYYNLKYI